MAHTRKDTFTVPATWCDHLRTDKRRVNKNERRFVKRSLTSFLDEESLDDMQESLYDLGKCEKPT